jgi:hypothetical protein
MSTSVGMELRKRENNFIKDDIARDVNMPCFNFNALKAFM